MDEFKPDKRKTTYRVLMNESKKPPRVIFSKTSLKWIRALMEEHDTEIGFYAVVDELEVGVYFIGDVFYPKHELVTGSTCEISPEGETEIMQYLIDKDRTDDIAKIRFWGHKHPGNRATGPSGQDETQAIERMASTGAFLIRAICSGDEISVSFFDHDNQIRFDNLKWEIEAGDSADVLIRKLNRVQEVLDGENTEENVSDRYVEIAKIFSVDEEMTAIKAKVKELKKVNVPEEKAWHGNGHCQVNDRRSGNWNGRNNNFHGSQQTNLLPHKPRTQTIARSSSGGGIDPKETALLLEDIDQDIDDFYDRGFM